MCKETRSSALSQFLYRRALPVGWCAASYIRIGTAFASDVKSLVQPAAETRALGLCRPLKPGWRRIPVSAASWAQSAPEEEQRQGAGVASRVCPHFGRGGALLKPEPAIGPS